jgi:DNA primase
MTEEIVFCFDGDEAGRRAAVRALSNTLPEINDGQQARFLFLPDGEDPDSLVRKDGFDGFMHRVKQAQSLADFLFQHLQTQADISRVDGKARLASLAQGWIDKVREGFLKQLLLSQLADLIGLSVQQIQENYQPETPEIIQENAQVQPVYQSYSNEFDLPPDAHVTLPIYPPVQRELSVRIGFAHRALAWLIRFPQLANKIEPTKLSKLVEQPEHEALIKVVTLLQQAPQQDMYFAFDYLCQHGLRETLSPIASSDYLWLEAANEDHKDEQVFAKLELEKIINALTHKAPDTEYETLKKRVLALDPSLTDVEKQRYRELLKQRKQ